MGIGLHQIWNCIGYWIALDIAPHWMLHAMDIGYGLDIGYRVGHWSALDVAVDWIGCRIALDIGLNQMVDRIENGIGLH